MWECKQQEGENICAFISRFETIRIKANIGSANVIHFFKRAVQPRIMALLKLQCYPVDNVYPLYKAADKAGKILDQARENMPFLGSNKGKKKNGNGHHNGQHHLPPSTESAPSSGYTTTQGGKMMDLSAG